LLTGVLTWKDRANDQVINGNCYSSKD